MNGLVQDCPLLLSSVLEHGARNFARVPIIGRYPGESIHYDYAGAHVRARRLASSLNRLGIGLGDFLGSLAWNTHRHLELLYAATGIGAVLHTANPRLPPEHIAYTVNFTGYRTLFVDAETIGLAEQLAPRLESVDRTVLMVPRDRMPETTLTNVLSYEDLIEDGDDAFAWPRFDERLASILCFTSGTTGAPKGVLYSHRGTVLSALSAGSGNGWALSADDTMIAIAGFFHCNGWGVPFFGPMFGAKLVLPGRRMDSEWLHRLIVEEDVTVAPGVPTIWLGMLQFCRERGYGLGQLQRIFSGGTAPPAAMIEAYMRDHGIRTLHGWGMTETTHAATVSVAPRDAATTDVIAAARTQGKPLYGDQIRIVDESGIPVPHDGTRSGHLEARGHWIASGYFRQPDIALESTDGWMKTGDIAVIDPDNTLHIVDRAKDVIKSGGEWISSIALEEAAISHPGLSEATVIAVPDPRWQERPLLIAVLEEGAHVTTEELRAYLAARVPKWWLPDTILFADELPHGPTGKVQKDVLRGLIEDGKLTN